ncbi:unnamed protein product [Jaminaea pallidilutea]
MGPPSNLASLNLGGAAGGQWSQSSSEAAYTSDSSYDSHTPGSMHSGDDSGSDSGMGWPEASSSHYNPSSIPRQQQQQQQHHAFASVPMTSDGSSQSSHLGSSSGYGMPQGQDQSSLITPTTFMARHGFGPLHPGSSNLLQHQHGAAPRLSTDLDRSMPTFKNEDGEETPIGRMPGTFAAALPGRGIDPGRDPRNRGAATLPTAASSHPHHGSSLHRQASQPDPSAMWNTPSAVMYEGGHFMTPTATPDPMGPPGQPFQPAVGQRAQTLTSQRSKPQPHRLLTGANMPQPPSSSQGQSEGHHGANLTNTGVPSSSKPLFSAMIDLSGWLDEPVVPSPLYPTGPSLAPFQNNAPMVTIPEGAETASNEQTQQQQHSNTLQDSSMQIQSTVPMPQQEQPQQQGAASNTGATQEQQQQNSQMPASRYWWTHPPSQNDYSLMQGVAQATANHLSHYPHLMVLPDPSSPVPPTVHRPWMANIRGNIPAPLAIARVILAGYAVRLPASESIVWESIARETRRIVDAHGILCSNTTSDLDVFGATQSLFFYCILLMMCNDVGAVGHVDVSLTNSAFFGLSQLAKTLAGRVHSSQARARSVAASAAASAASFAAMGDAPQATPHPDWLSWGFEESMRRTVWAAYSMLVLQRYRDSADMSQGRLAGIDLILDLELPAVALEFEAQTEDEWVKQWRCRSGNVWTFRDLLRYRPSPSAAQTGGFGPEVSSIGPSGAQSGNTRGGATSTTGPSAGTPSSFTSSSPSAPPDLLDYFERHDAFVATVLSIAFCLDTNLSV